jgi:threonine dehydratase
VAPAPRSAFSRLQLVREPGGAVALAAVLAGTADAEQNSLVIASSGNLDADSFAAMLAAS